MHEYVKYADGTLVVFSDIRKKDNEKSILLLVLKDQKNIDLIQ